MSRLNIKKVNRILSMLFNAINHIEAEKESIIGHSVVHIFTASEQLKVIDLGKSVDMELASIERTLQQITEVILKMSKGNTEKIEKYIREKIGRINDSNTGLVPFITSYETDLIIKGIDKYIVKGTYNDPVVELLKDFDAVERYFNGIKSEGAYLERCKKVFSDYRSVEAM